jgi:thiol:disulfide interchange protein DsbA
MRGVFHGEMMGLQKTWLSLAIAVVWVLASSPATAQIVSGKDYRPVTPPQPTDSGKKVELIEFFSYACPACNILQPRLKSWLARKPADVEFRRVPALFPDRVSSWGPLTRAYYALDAMGAVEKVHYELFAAIHDRKSLDLRTVGKDSKPLFDWIAKQGVDRQKFAEAYNSFGVQNLVQRSIDLSRNYDIPGTPTIVVDGKYLTMLSMTMNPDETVNFERFFRVIDELIVLARKQRAGK